MGASDALFRRQRETSVLVVLVVPLIRESCFLAPDCDTAPAAVVAASVSLPHECMCTHVLVEALIPLEQATACVPVNRS